VRNALARGEAPGDDRHSNDSEPVKNSVFFK
jgi:hypothetical protein